MTVDWSLRAALLVAVGGAIGSVLRYVVGATLSRGQYPWGTLVVNLVGSFMIGVVLFAALSRGEFAPDTRAFLVTGVLGGFTTMSSFAYESIALADDAGFARSAGYVALTVIGCLAMAAAGRLVGVRL